ncbi:MAG: hypothetical protein JW891_06330 [Candidatus Lokiarchaeota archaeon]|nr:hypothetical protein [Candidatus Lokiarchaeota archaeon]
MATVEISWILVFFGYWTIFFIRDNKTRMTEAEYKHELSFPFPDLGWITPCLLVGAIGSFTNQNYGIFFSVLAGSGMIFLGVIDLAFNLQNHCFNREKKGFDAIISIGVVILTLAFGLRLSKLLKMLRNNSHFYKILFM